MYSSKRDDDGHVQTWQQNINVMGVMLIKTVQTCSAQVYNVCVYIVRVNHGSQQRLHCIAVATLPEQMAVRLAGSLPSNTHLATCYYATRVCTHAFCQMDYLMTSTQCSLIRFLQMSHEKPILWSPISIVAALSLIFGKSSTRIVKSRQVMQEIV